MHGAHCDIMLDFFFSFQNEMKKKTQKLMENENKM